jgi:group I intron endonuclease
MPRKAANRAKSRRRPVSGIYKLTIGSWYYYGSARDYRRRRQSHLQTLRGNRHANGILQNAFNKHGEKSVKFRLVERVRDHSELLSREQVWIDLHHGKPRCANLARDAGHPVSGPRSPETKRKISETLRRKGHKPGPEAHRKKACGKTARKGVIISFESVKEAARRLRVSARSIQFWLSGKRTCPAGLTVKAA